LTLLGKELPQANLLAVRYPVGWLANSRPTTIARELERVIGTHYTTCQSTSENGYKTIILLGYSTGALLVRQAFLLGMGENQGDDLTPVPIVHTRQEWTTKVDRIVLLAGMNRGWSLDRKPSGMRWIDWVLAQAVRPLLSLANVSGFLFDIERGAPFVANLRLSWVRAVAKYPQSFPTVVQILGRSDEVVTREDETDMAAAIGFVFIPAGDVNHNSILDVQEEGPAKAAVLDALRLPTQTLLTRYGVNSLVSGEDSRVTRIIFVRHGIRDDNRWAPELRHLLCESARAQGNPCKDNAPLGYHGSLTQVNIDSYGYFGMLPFLLQNIRQDKVRDFVDSYTEEVAKTRNPDVRVDFVGHSNGTYVLAAGLEKYRTLVVHSVVFADSVVACNYDWPGVVAGNQLRGPVRNYMGAEDWVVAIFPRLFEMLYFLGDLGSAGFAGFLRGPGVDGNQTLTGGHDAGIKKENWNPIVDFLFADGDAPNPNAVSGSNAFIKVFWKFPYIGWVLAGGVVGLVFFGAFRLSGFGVGKLPRKTRVPIQVLLASLVVFLLLIQV